MCSSEGTGPGPFVEAAFATVIHCPAEFLRVEKTTKNLDERVAGTASF